MPDRGAGGGPGPGPEAGDEPARPVAGRGPCGEYGGGGNHYLSAAPRSQHPGGVNATFHDGRVQFLPNRVDELTMARMISCNDGQAIDMSLVKP